MSPTDVCNQALDLIGEKPITNIDDDNDRAHKCKRAYDTELRATLRDHEWNCAIDWFTLAASLTPPASGFAFAYERDPLDLRVLSVNNDDCAIWKVSKRLIVTDQTACVAKCITFVEDPDVWDSLLASAFVTRLGSKLLASITHDYAKAQQTFAFYQQMIDGAKGVNGQEGSAEAFVANDLINVRR